MKAHKAYVALGSNLHDPMAQITQCFADLARIPKTEVVARSSLYSSAPVGCGEQADFINAVAELSTDLTPQELLQELFEMEHRHGRQRRTQNAPRTLDLDLLSFDQLISTEHHLTLPHPRMHERAFVLMPLCEIAPNYVIPGKGRASEYLLNCSAQTISRYHHAA